MTCQEFLDSYVPYRRGRLGLIGNSGERSAVGDFALRKRKDCARHKPSTVVFEMARASSLSYSGEGTRNR